MMSRKTASTQITLGIVMALALVMGLEALGEVASTHGWQVDLSTGDGRHSFTFNQPDGRLSLKTRGDVQLNDDGVVRIADGASLRIHEKADHKKTVRTLDVDGRAGGTPTYRYRVNGDDRPFDDDAKAWLRDVLVTYFRRSGASADERAQRIVDAGGSAALIEEIGHLESDHVTVLYLAALMNLEPLEEEHVVEGLKIAGRTIDSDHHLAELLESMEPRWLVNESTARAMLNAASEISSDHHLAEVLTSMLRHRNQVEMSPAVISALLDTSRAIDSDHHRAELLTSLASYDTQRPLPSNLARALDEIGSDHHKSRAIQAFLGRSSLSNTQLDDLLRVAASGIASGHHASEVLVVLARERRWGESSEAELPAAAFVLLSSIEGDHHQRQAAESLLAAARPADRVRVLEASRLSSDHQIADLLIAASRYNYAQIEIHPTVRQMLSTLSSDHHRQRAADAWGL